MFSIIAYLRHAKITLINFLPTFNPFGINLHLINAEADSKHTAIPQHPYFPIPYFPISYFPYTFFHFLTPSPLPIYNTKAPLPIVSTNASGLFAAATLQLFLF